MLADEGADDVQVRVINTQVMECTVIGRWMSLADLWQVSCIHHFFNIRADSHFNLNEQDI